MNFKTASSVETFIWSLLLGQQDAARNRSLLNLLANGAPPYTEEEAKQNHNFTNVNSLEFSDLLLGARRHISNAICSADPLFSLNLDYGPVHKRQHWGKTIEKEVNKILVDSSDFYDLREGVAGSVVLHGVGPSVWEDDERWLQTELGVEDVLMPSGTLRSLRNLPAFAIYRKYSINQLYNLTHGPKVDPGWNMPLVENVLEWVDKETTKLMSDNFNDTWFPEKRVERWKEDSGCYASDMVPTVDAYDFFFWDDDGKEEGWKRRIIIDAWGSPGAIQAASSNRLKGTEFAKGKFLYDSGDRIYADKLDKFIHFQFGDASAVRPARYKSIRSLGWLTYSVCHLQNRLKCKFNDAVFESLMQYFRVNDPADRDRLQKIDLVHMGILQEGLNFVKPEERWKVDKAFVSEAISMNRQTMAEQSSSFVQDYDQENGEGETATRTMAKVNSQASLVSSMMNTIYYREEGRYREICRRVCIANSKDADVRSFRVKCLRQGVPEEALNSERWNIKINKIMGGGNRMLEVAIADKMFEKIGAYPPEAQNEIKRMYAGSITGDWKLASSWVPDLPTVSDSMHDAEITFGALMSGSKVSPRPGLNALEVVETMLREIESKVQEILQSGGVGTPADFKGLTMADVYTESFIKQLAQDDSQKNAVKQFGDRLGKAGNEIKAMGQRQQQAAQKSQAQNGQDPAAQAKVQALMMTAQAKIQQGKESHANKTAQRQLSFEQKQRESSEKHAADLQKEMASTHLELSAEHAKAQLELSKRKQLFDEE